jgi:type II secretory pathway predicted ATPase ExeA
MYERFYGFKERPFSLLPDPDFLFLGNKHQAALDLLELTILNQAGFCVVSGEIGAGKTTLLRELLKRLDEDICVGLISNTHPSFGELLQWITAAFGLSSDSSDKFELHKRFLEFVIQQYTDNKRTLLIIDEAQNLSVSAMEELRMLSNINSDKDLVLQVILVGQSQLRDKLQLPELKQFAQRIAVDYHLAGLDERETYDYIRYRVTRAGGSPDLFSEDACRTVYRCTDGIPRLINGLCDSCLVYGYSAKSPVIVPELVREVVRDQRTGQIGTPTDRSTERRDEPETTAHEASDAETPALVEGRPGVQPEVESIAVAAAEAPMGELSEDQKQPAGVETAPDAGTEFPTLNNRSNPPRSDAAPETIVGAMEAALLQEGGQAKTSQAGQRRFAEIDRLTGSDSEGGAGLGGPFSGVQPDPGRFSGKGNFATAHLALGLALVIGVGAAGGLVWLLGSERPLNATVALPLAGTAGPPATSIDVADTVPGEVVVGGQPTEKGAAPEAEQHLDRERREAEERLAAQLEAERLARERREAEERLAAQLEAERLDRERREAEQRLAAQLEAERLEQRLRREAEERLAAQREVARLERERREAEARLVAQREAKRKAALAKWNKTNNGIGWSDVPEEATTATSSAARPSASAPSGSPDQGPRAGGKQSQPVSSGPTIRASALSEAELEAKRAAALAAWQKANGGIGWSEELEDDDGEID